MIDFTGSGAVTLNGQAYKAVNSQADLAAIAAANNLSGNYILGSNINIFGAWTTPLGSATQAFTGSLNGFGHKISVGSLQTNGTGLFGTIGGGATVSNLGIDANLQPNPANTGKATRPAAVNTASIGILADINNGSIVNSFATGNIAVQNPTAPNATIDNVGGLVGDNFGLIAGSYASALVQATLNAGGFVGVNEAPGRIYTSSSRLSGFQWVRGDSSAIAYTGGFAAVNAGLISQSYTAIASELSGDAVGPASHAISGGRSGQFERIG